MALPWTTGASPWKTGPANPTVGATVFGGNAPTPTQPTPAQLADQQRLAAMTPEQRQQYIAGQAAGQSSAGHAAYDAGNYQASQVSPGGPQSAGVLANQARQKQADAAGLDFMKPGINERFMQSHGNDLLTGGASSDFWGGYGTDLMGAGNSQKVFDEAQANRPQLPSANLEPYYDRARQNATTKLGAAQASRGAYGSSVGVGQVGSMLADLGAQQAKDEADYGLKRSDLERNWMTARGDLASAADRDSVSRWTATGSGAATADEAALNRWRTTQQAAESAQGSQRTRGQDLFSNNMTLGNALSGTVKDSFETGAVQDQGIMDAIIKLGLAKDAAGVADVMRQAQQDEALQQKIMDAVKYYDTKSNTEEPKK